jgi:hypothetical protein
MRAGTVPGRHAGADMPVHRASSEADEPCGTDEPESPRTGCRTPSPSGRCIDSTNTGGALHPERVRRSAAAPVTLTTTRARGGNRGIAL